ncbi:putative quinol monooxygenase [Saccharibacillus alkalitolerans]|uniref:Antibiotic biosynthesis monooxygenase n=1 Tax=Saccharibacillus alkalitolerans TaxID=2705290 RepID=A0ABX0F8U5_9BACL|nr:putative quinol monooxygenase [Saccharibacillus alkalitolerans]NGZ77297.1 antibiotic biosynthesis monooxygenase [Saccharibacillus alkalitolerans]
MIIIHATFQVNPAKEETFLNAMKPLVEASQAEEGNIAYDLHKAVGRDNVYTMVEVWRDQEATAIHNKSEHFTKFAASASEYLTAPLEIKAFAGEELPLS